MKSLLTTLCYIEKDDSYLMLHRVKKQNDINKDKWIGVGGHFENAESPDECLLREVKEETGLILNSYKFCGIVTFVSKEDGKEDIFEYMCLYTSDDFSGELIECDEGQLEWVKKSELKNLNFWEGDYIFLNLIEKNVPFFSLKLIYNNGKLIETFLNGALYEG
jgi:8-oxo-dGTP diphosphatase